MGFMLLIIVIFCVVFFVLFVAVQCFPHGALWYMCLWIVNFSFSNVYITKAMCFHLDSPLCFCKVGSVLLIFLNFYVVFLFCLSSLYPMMYVSFDRKFSNCPSVLSYMPYVVLTARYKTRFKRKTCILRFRG